ncbi:MAG: winged helix-turn-helix transcriptional regulator [Candidatus Heimdallarchaeota archaeon]|nr:MAG: winged helix-turn-helix transcriptional regulator [Candidatus Heimdallarchaeota archaeon]
MSSNQIMKTIEGRDHPSSKLTISRKKARPAIVHEIDRKILKVVQTEGPLTRSRLSSITGIPRSTLYDSLWRLIVKGYVKDYSEDRKHRGRPRTYFAAI